METNKIEEAAYRFATSQTHGELLALIDGYKEGYKDAINEFQMDLWHPASEEPKKFRKILYTGDSIDTTDTTMLIINNSWNTKVYLLKIKKWCYIDDLFPKKGGKQ